MSIDYKGFSVRLDHVMDDLFDLSKREPHPKEARLPVTVAHRHRRATRAISQAMRARERAAKTRSNEYESEQMAKAFDKLADAEFELQCARELAAELDA